ncbi:DUF397 domain-containing protein [Actinomadura nitritigenes]|uniref:DUF397 domain-containing protein n=1 Tax=Actinomadura nitritigenes TaxID=134602 RepID=UPI0027DEA724|nr:DUF397 domain-containing protein [Actinomadura nitritigenes]
MKVAPWRKSSHSSGGTSGECVELKDLGSAVGVRDSKAPEAGHLALTPGAFADLVARVKQGDLSA